MKASRFIPSAHKLSHDAPSRRRRPRLLRKSVNSPCLGDADRVCFANRSVPPVSATPTAFASQIGQFPAGEGWQNALISSAYKLPHARHTYYAGVQTMRARICSAFSCDMFARVVWLRLRRARDYRISLCYLPHALATHGSRD